MIYALGVKAEPCQVTQLQHATPLQPLCLHVAVHWMLVHTATALQQSAGVTHSLKNGLQVVHVSEAAAVPLPVRKGEHLRHTT
jgi:hypothetical protein